MNRLNIAVSVVLAALATAFSLANTMPVSIGFLALSSDQIPLFVPVFVSFFMGFSGGVLALSFTRRKHKKEIAFLRKENAVLHQEVENLRNIPLQDDL